MRILHWTEHFWPMIGGTELLVLRLAGEQQRRGHEVLVVTDQVAELPGEAECEGVAVRRLAFTRALQAKDAAGVARVAAETARVKRVFGADVVHLHFNGMTAWFHLLTAGPAGGAGAATLATLHTPFDALPASGDMVARVLGASRGITAVSEALLRELHARDGTTQGRSGVVHNGFPAPAAGTVELELARPTLLCLGRLSREKGVDVALRAMARIGLRWPACRLVVAGGGPERGRLEALAAELGLGGRVEFRGWVEPDRVADAINAATIVLVPSVWQEPFGLVALQAAQLGRPVVASDAGGLGEVVQDGETGRLVPAGDAAALAAAIEELLAQPDEARRLGANGARRARERFSIERCAAGYDAWYERVRAGAR